MTVVWFGPSQRHSCLRSFASWMWQAFGVRGHALSTAAVSPWPSSRSCGGVRSGVGGRALPCRIRARVGRVRRARWEKSCCDRITRKPARLFWLREPQWSAVWPPTIFNSALRGTQTCRSALDLDLARDLQALAVEIHDSERVIAHVLCKQRLAVTAPDHALTPFPDLRFAYFREVRALHAEDDDQTVVVVEGMIWCPGRAG